MMTMKTMMMVMMAAKPTLRAAVAPAMIAKKASRCITIIVLINQASIFSFAMSSPLNANERPFVKADRETVKQFPTCTYVN